MARSPNHIVVCLKSPALNVGITLTFKMNTSIEGLILKIILLKIYRYRTGNLGETNKTRK